MSENVKTRPRAGRRTTPAAEAAVAEAPAVEGAAADTAEATDTGADTVPTDAPTDVPTSAPGAVSGAAGAVGWADAVPWLALRWGSAPSAAEIRFAPVVWAMLTERPGRAGRTALQMAAEAELAGHDELDPAVLAKVLVRYEKAGVVRTVTQGRLTLWSVIDPADIVADAQGSARESGRTSAARTARTVGNGNGVASRVADGAPAGGLRGLVEDHLAEHPFEDFSPSQVAKALGRSSGAVANALERLTELGTALQTSASPRRYQHRPDTNATPEGSAADTDDLATATGDTDGGDDTEE